MFLEKKGQIKFGEVFGILIIVYFILIGGMIWYNKISSQKINKLAYEHNLNKALDHYYFIVNLHFLHYSELGDIDEVFDRSALLAFANFSNASVNRDYVFSNLGYSSITLNVYNNNFENIENITLYNKTSENFENRQVFSSLIPIIAPENSTVYIGLLKVVNFN